MNTLRTQLLIGEKGVEILKKRTVTIVGVGGVGGHCALALARAGITKMTLIDFDVVNQSNINRQAVANIHTIGKKKVDVLKQMLLDINPDMEINTSDEKLTQDNVERLVLPCDMCIDAIDSVKDKISLIIYCKQNNIPIISAMGAGNRFDIPHFYLTDIYKTHDDGLAKAVRKQLRQHNIASLEVVTTHSKPITNDSGVVGSISYYPAMCALTLVAVVINKFLMEGKDEDSK